MKVKRTKNDKVPDDIRFVGRWPLVSANTNKKSIRPNSYDWVQILRVSAFCFAIMSWYATANGLRNYVFNGDAWQAYLISFAIQAILFVLNLKLPGFYNDCKKSDGKKGNMRAYLLVVFYGLNMFASSFFSYVYIADTSYSKTKEIDADYSLRKEFLSVLDEADIYVSEFSKLTRLIISDRLSELQELVPDDMVIDETISEEEYNEARLVFEQKPAEITMLEGEVESLRERYEAALDAYNVPITERWRSSDEIEEERKAVEDSLAEVNSAREDLKNAQNEYESARLIINGYVPSADAVVGDILRDTLKIGISDETRGQFNSFVEALFQAWDSQSEDMRGVYPSVVACTQELSIALDNDMALAKIKEGSDDDSSSLNQLREEAVNTKLLMEGVATNSGDDGNKTNKQLVDIWWPRYEALEMLIRNLPHYSVSMSNGVSGAEESVDLGALRRFDVQETADRLSVISRSNMAEINAMERACRYLTCDYPFLAWFSLFFALFLDGASLVAGIFIFIIEKKNTVASEVPLQKGGSSRGDDEV